MSPRARRSDPAVSSRRRKRLVSFSLDDSLLGRRGYKRLGPGMVDATTNFATLVVNEFAREVDQECEMSSQGTGENRRRRVDAGTPRQANAEDLLAELKHLLNSSGHPSFAPPPGSTVFPPASTAPEPLQTTQYDKALDSADDFSADGPLKRSTRTFSGADGQYRESTGIQLKLARGDGNSWPRGSCWPAWPWPARVSR